MGTYTSDIQKLYVAYFNRPADALGLSFWESAATKYGASVLGQISTAFAASAEYQSTYAGMSNAQIVNQIYRNLFGRDAEVDGLTYWANGLSSGNFTIANAVTTIAAGAQGTDLAAYNAKVSAATKFTAALDTATEILNYSGATANNAAKAWLSTINSSATEAAATTTAALNATISGIVSPAPTPVAGQSYTLTTNVDAVSGGAGDDTITGVLATSNYSYNAGDNIDGGAGTDTLNLLDVSGTAASVVSIDNVETINVRSLVGTATDVTELDASDWNGVTTLTNASSTAGSELQVSGLSITTNVKLIGNADISIEFSNSTTANAAATLVDGGTFTGVSDYNATAVTAAATAHLNLDAGAAGRVSAITVDLAGNNLVNIEAGANVEVYTLRGSGSAVLFTDDTLVSVDASAFAGNLDIALNGVSDVSVTTGGGNDKIRVGTTISNNDTFNGGAGTDTIAATIGGFARTLNTTAIEVADLTFNDDAGGTVNATSSSVSTFNLLGGSNGADANVAGVVSGASINVGSGGDNLDDVNVGVATGGSTTVNFGTASGKIVLDDFLVSGASTVSLRISGGTAGAGSADDVIFDGASTVTITTVGAESDFTAADVSASSASVVTINTNGSAIFFAASALEGASALTALTLRASGSDAADITLKSVPTATAQFDNISLVGVSGADITVSGTILFGNGLTAADTGSITMSAEGNSVVGTTALDVAVSGAFGLTLNLGAAATGTVQIGDIRILDGTAGTAQASAQSLTISPVTVGAVGLVAIDKLVAGSGAGATGASAGFNLNVGAITVGTTGGFTLFSAGLVASGVDDLDVSSINVSLATGASALFGAISTTAGSVGSITVSAAASGSASFGAINASSIGAITIGASGSTAEVDFAGLTAVSNIGAITIVLTQDADVTVGAISAGGDIGNIVIGNTKSGSAVFSTIGASSIGNITISGAGVVSFGAMSASRVGTIDATQMVSGTFTADLSVVTNAVEIRLNSAANTIISGLGNDVITLLGGRTAVSGQDVIRYTNTAHGVDNIINFIAGTTASGGDQIEMATAMGSAILTAANGSAIANATEADLSAVITGTGTTLAAADNVVLIGTAMSNTAAMISFFSTGIALASAAVATATFVVAWTDGTDTYVSLLGATGAGSAGATTLGSGGHTVTTTTLVTLSGVTPGAFATGNFDFV